MVLNSQLEPGKRIEARGGGGGNLLFSNNKQFTRVLSPVLVFKRYNILSYELFLKIQLSPVADRREALSVTPICIYMKSKYLSVKMLYAERVFT